MMMQGIKLIVYYFINLLVLPSKIIKNNSLLLIRLDAIGDYVLFRNFIKLLKVSEEYKGHKITLVGNSAWKTLALELDTEFVGNFIWLDRRKFTNDFIYRYKKLKEITSQGYEIVLNPAFSREYFFGDNIVRLTTSENKIGSIGDLSNIKIWQKRISDKYYNQLIAADSNIMFEFSRNKEFLENLLQYKLAITKPNIVLNDKVLKFDLPEKYAILFIGGSADFRKWDIENFSRIARYLKDKYGYSIVLCGGPNDREEAIKFSHIFNNDYIDLVGKTSLIDLLYIIYNGNLMIANETSAPHFAVALEMTNIFVISNGNHYGRFTPYPQNICENYHVVYHPEIEKDTNRYKELCGLYSFGSKLNINDISVTCVENKLDDMLRLPL